MTSGLFLVCLRPNENFLKSVFPEQSFPQQCRFNRKADKNKRNRLSRTMVSQRISPRWPPFEASRSRMCKWLGLGTGQGKSP